MAAEFLAKPTWNPLDVVSDPRVSMASAGALGSYALRKAAFRAFRDTFGHAASTEDGELVYYAVDADGNVDTSREVEGARMNRALFGVSHVVLGSLMIGQVQDPNVDYLGLGLAASGAAATILTLVGVD